MFLNRRVERFLRRSGMSASHFGRQAAGYPNLVFEMRRGRELRPSTATRVAAYLDEQEERFAPNPLSEPSTSTGSGR